ncbi:12255_t:CDS:1, partial [Cetraspora pellucida]
MNHSLNNEIERSSMPTTPHIKVIPANQNAESWVWLFVDKKTRRCQVQIEDNGVKIKCPWYCREKTSTTNIASHLRSKHRIIEEKEKVEISSTCTISKNYSLEQNKIERITY